MSDYMKHFTVNKNVKHDLEVLCLIAVGKANHVLRFQEAQLAEVKLAEAKLAEAIKDAESDKDDINISEIKKTVEDTNEIIITELREIVDDAKAKLAKIEEDLVKARAEAEDARIKFFKSAGIPLLDSDK